MQACRRVDYATQGVSELRAILRMPGGSGKSRFIHEAVMLGRIDISDIRAALPELGSSFVGGAESGEQPHDLEA